MVDVIVIVVIAVVVGLAIAVLLNFLRSGRGRYR